MLKKKYILWLIGIYIFWLCVLPFIVSSAVDVVCKNFSHNSSFELKVTKPRVIFSVIPIVKLKFDEIELVTKNKSLSANIDNLALTLRILPLFSGRCHVNSLEVGKVNLKTTLSKDLSLDKDFFCKLNSIPISVDSFSIGEFAALLYQEDLVKPIEYKGQDFSYQKKNRYIKFKNNSSLNVAGNISKVSSNLYLPKNNDIDKTIFDIEISKVNIAPLRAYFKHYLPKDLQELRGEISVNATKTGLITELSNCGIIMKDNAKSIIFPDKMYIKSQFNINRKFINFENIDIYSKNISIFMDGKFSDYFGKTKPSVDMDIRIEKSKLEDIVKLLPAFKVEEIDTYKLKKYNLYGDILANFSIKGRLPEPDVYGDIYIDNVVLVKPIPNTTKGATIKLNLAGKQANFDVVVPAGNLEKVWVNGSQELYNIKYANLTVKSTDNVNLKSAQDVVNPLHEVLNFVVGPVPIMKLDGLGKIDIIVKGNRKNPHIWGSFDIKDGTACFLDMPIIKANNIIAGLRFVDQKVDFALQKAFLNEKPLLVQGSCDLYGKFDFDVSSKDQPTEYLYNAINVSKILSDIQKMLPKLTSIRGLTDFSLKIYGNVKNIDDLKFNENVFSKGTIQLKNNNYIVDNIKVEDTNGQIKIDSALVETDLVAHIGDLPLKIKAKLKDDLADLILDIPKLNPNFLISDLKTRSKQYLPYLQINARYRGKIKEIEYDKLKLNAKVLGATPASKIMYYPDGSLDFDGNKASIKGIKGYINNEQNSFDVNLQIDNPFAMKPDINGEVKFKIPDLTLLNEIIATDILPEKVKALLGNVEFKQGGLDLNAKIFASKVNFYSDLSGIELLYKPFSLPIEIINGSLSAKNNTLKVNKINLLADGMPLLIDGDIKDVFDQQKFNLYVNSKPKQEFIDKYINTNQIYPIKIKGDIVYWLRVKGVPENFDLKALIDMSKDSSFYHFGATIGDVENSIEVSIESKILNRNIHKIREFSYDKKIDSQSGRQTKLNLLKAWGGVQILKDDLVFENLRIKTNHPTDARIFNIIFRKPNIKQGQFKSDLRINGKLSDAKVIGDFHIFETNIPFMDTTMKNIELVFKDKSILFDSKGEVMGNDVLFNGVLKNKLTLPYKIEKAYLYTKHLDLDRIINKIKLAEIDDVSTFDSLEGFDINSIVTDNFIFKADNIKLRNIHATNFEAKTSLNTIGVFNVDNFRFNIAQGILQGKYAYNLKNNDVGINLRAKNISANDITWALFDLNNQIYGDLTGDVNLTCNGVDFNQCMQTLSGSTSFNVKDGSMPKLGSLEYLLKAGNLIKGGLTSLSINSVIDLIAPSKTGVFSDITGFVRIKDGVARNIEITTKGEGLSLFVGGTYNFATSVADMEVLGLLSKKISTMLGPIGNVSINTLFNVIPGVDLSKDSLVLERINKIPGIELSSKAYRKFIAEIKGNINGDDYVTSFKWIN